MKDQKELRELSDLGEFALIKELTQDFRIKNSNTIKGVGDDAAVIKTDKYTVVTTDLLVEGIHFDLTYTPLKHLGYKSVVVNLSDVYSMNAIPKQITVSLAVSNRFSVEGLKEIYSGIKMACDKYNVDLIGGDTSSSRSGLIISVTAIGEADKDEIVYRSGAKVNDLICVSGDLGAAYMGLQLLEREKEIFRATNVSNPDFEGYDYILERILKPEAKVDVIEFLKSNQVVPTSMIDISDGLSSEILHLCDSSGVGCKIFEDKLPISSETKMMSKEFSIEVLISAMSGGEDYELLFTISMDHYSKLSKLLSGSGISVIGHILEKGMGHDLVLKDGSLVPILAQGWNTMD